MKQLSKPPKIGITFLGVQEPPTLKEVVAIDSLATFVSQAKDLTRLTNELGYIRAYVGEMVTEHGKLSDVVREVEADVEMKISTEAEALLDRIVELSADVNGLRTDMERRTDSLSRLIERSTRPWYVRLKDWWRSR